MTSAATDQLLEMRGIKIEGQSEDTWFPIIKGMDLTLRRGEVLGLIGESGAGKSTMGLAAMGFARDGCRITDGSVVFDGRDLLTLSDAARRKLWGVRIAYVAQSAAAAFNPAHRLLDQCVETALFYGVSADEARKNTIDLFHRLRLPDPNNIGNRYPHQVSGGQLQRVMTAMAMACGPDMIIFDEPTTALDVTTQIEVLASIKDVVHQLQKAAIYISHDLAVVAQMADRIMVLRYGELVEEAPTHQMLSDPQQPYTKSLWAVRSLRKDEETSPDIVLKVRNVNAAYSGTVQVLHDINIEVPRARTVAVVGESGSGKSTLARVITGLLPPLSGEVEFDGERLPPTLGQRTKSMLRNVQMIYQMPDPALNPKRRVGAMLGRAVGYHLGLTGKARDRRISELLEMIELDDSYRDRLPMELSGGQKQRICIARALAVEPELVICDEVTSALDQIVAEEILKLLTASATRTRYYLPVHYPRPCNGQGDCRRNRGHARGQSSRPRTEVASVGTTASPLH